MSDVTGYASAAAKLGMSQPEPYIALDPNTDVSNPSGLNLTLTGQTLVTGQTLGREKMAGGAAAKASPPTTAKPKAAAPSSSVGLMAGLAAAAFFLFRK